MSSSVVIRVDADVYRTIERRQEELELDGDGGRVSMSDALRSLLVDAGVEVKPS